MKMEIKSKWTGAAAGVLLLLSFGAFAATDDLSTTLSKGLFEEEANHNPGAAIRVYQSLIDRFDTDRKLAATAVFRLGECYRKQGSTNEANAQYQRILREFADQAPLVTLSRQNLVALGGAAAAQTGPSVATPGAGAENASPVVDAGELSRVEAIIKNSPDLINAPDQSGQTLLQTYAGRGDIEVVKLLLDSGAEPNGIKQLDLTPLHFAAGNGNKAVVDLLLSKGAKADVTTESGVTPLHLAVLKGYQLVAKDLIEAGAPVNAQVGKDVDARVGRLIYDFHAGQTPLQIACDKGYHSLADLLIARGADVNTPNGVPPLYVAAAANDEVLVKTLLAAHADPNKGRSALNAAAAAGNLQMMDLLLAHGADPNVNDSLGTAISSKHPEAVKKLIDFKADPNGKNGNGVPLIFSALKDPPTLLALLEGGADPNQSGLNGEFPLEATAQPNGYTQALEMLLTHGADPNKVFPGRGFTALHLAVYGKTGAVKLLLKHGAKVNAQANDGSTALRFAVNQRNTEVAALLLDNGADPNLRDNNGLTPLDIAKQQPPLMGPPAVPGGVGTASPLPYTPAKPISIVELLRQHGATEDLPRFDRIEVRRFPNYTATVFSRSTNGVNRFSLLELLAVHYGFISDLPYPRPSQFPPYDGRSRTLQRSLAFPNFDRIEIRRPKPDGKHWTRIPVQVQSILESGDCSRDVWLQWGDQVEIPESDHPLDERWKGFPGTAFNNLQNCVTRHVEFTVKGQSTNLTLRPLWPVGYGASEDRSFSCTPPQFYLAPALDNSGLCRTSSDLSHVKVTRHNSASGENWDQTFDCSGSTPYPDLWLRDGDIIEVPDKP